MGIKQTKGGHVISCDAQLVPICAQRMWAKGDILEAARGARWIVYPLVGPKGNHLKDWTICRHCSAQILADHCVMVEEIVESNICIRPDCPEPRMQYECSWCETSLCKKCMEEKYKFCDRSPDELHDPQP